jgi:hypothetical protein
MMTHHAPTLTTWSLVLLCFSTAAAIGGGLYEKIVLVPIWSESPPSSFAIIQPGTGVPLQSFWIPVHTAITIFLILSLVLSWRRPEVRRLLLIGLCSYALMRGWSFAYFIPEMLAFQQVPLDSPPSAELTGRVESWTFWTVFRAPLDVISFGCYIFALRRLGKGTRQVERSAPLARAAARS